MSVNKAAARRLTEFYWKFSNRSPKGTFGPALGLCLEADGGGTVMRNTASQQMEVTTKCASARRRFHVQFSVLLPGLFRCARHLIWRVCV